MKEKLDVLSKDLKKQIKKAMDTYPVQIADTDIHVMIMEPLLDIFGKQIVLYAKEVQNHKKVDWDAVNKIQWKKFSFKKELI